MDGLFFFKGGIGDFVFWSRKEMTTLSRNSKIAALKQAVGNKSPANVIKAALEKLPLDAKIEVQDVKPYATKAWGDIVFASGLPLAPELPCASRVFSVLCPKQDKEVQNNIQDVSADKHLVIDRVRQLGCIYLCVY